MGQRVPFHIGPVADDVARTWLSNSAEIVAAVHAHPEVVSFVLDRPLLELCEVYLGLWRDHASAGDVFEWDAEVDVEHVESLVRQWLLLAHLSDDELTALGVHWAPEWTRPFYDALLHATVTALAKDPTGRRLAAQLADRPPGTPE
jgi:hypothetical protein